MTKINQCKTGCYLLDVEAFRLRSQKSLEGAVFNGNALKIDSLYTEAPVLTTKTNHDIFEQERATLSINDHFFHGKFFKMKDTRLHFYRNSENDTCSINITKFIMFKHQNLKPLKPLNIKRLEFAFLIHAFFPSIDMMAAKIMSHENVLVASKS